MPALNFPSTPAINDTFSASGITYTWDGQRWLAGISSGATGLTGPAGATGLTGATGTAGTPGSAGTAGATGATGITGGATYAVGNSGASSYVINGLSSPTISLLRGFTYYFAVAATGHPFWIKTAQVTGTGSAYTSGVTNNGVDNGTVTFQVPLDAPSTLYYICQFHGSMTGTLNISDVGPMGATGATGAQGSIGATGITGNVGATGAVGSVGATGLQGLTGATGITGNIGATGASGPGADQTLNTTSSVTFANVTINNLLSLTASSENLTNISGATGTVTHDCSTGTIFFHTSLVGNFTANFVNLPTTNNRVLSVVLVLQQGATPFICTALQIDGVSQTINYINATSPTGTANRREIQSFSLFRSSNTWTVLGTLGSFG